MLYQVPAPVEVLALTGGPLRGAIVELPPGDMPPARYSVRAAATRIGGGPVYVRYAYTGRRDAGGRRVYRYLPVSG